LHARPEERKKSVDGKKHDDTNFDLVETASKLDADLWSDLLKYGFQVSSLMFGYGAGSEPHMVLGRVGEGSVLGALVFILES
jgi:hypothetical protein